MPGKLVTPSARLQRPGPGPRFGGPGPVVFLVVAALAGILISPALFARQEAAKPKEQPKQEQAAAGPATYVGSETCQTCHEDIAKAFAKNPHAVVDKKKGWETKACESCHGPGSKHAESTSPADIVNPAKLTPAAADQGCLKCHLNSPTHSGRIRGGHARNQVSCTACHAVHKGMEALHPRRLQSINKQCAECHNEVWAQFAARPHTHPLAQGGMACTDCHNPHGSFLARSIQTVSANEPNCLKCHGDKRGPFTFEHAPVRLEGCTACHEPHGSTNPHQLTRAEVRYVCLECHANINNAATAKAGVLGGVPPAFHDLRSPRYRNCTICHIKVHGSYVSRSLLR